MTYSVYQHWDPLRVCVVGQAYPPEFYQWIEDPLTRNKFEQVAIETEEDFQALISLLKKFDVEILRPDIPGSFDDCLVDNIWVPPPVTPRDYFVQIHDKLWLPTEPNANHAHHAFKKQNKLSWEQFTALDQAKHDRKLKFYHHVLSKCNIQQTEHTYISGCFVSRLGKDLFFATQSIFDDWDLIYQQVDRLFPDTNNHIVDAQGHGDAVYCPIAPGLIISIADEDYSSSFPDWEIVHLEPSHYAKHKQFQSSMKINAGRWYIPGFDKHPEIVKTVETYFDEWVGEASETVFGVNILCIDNKNIVLSDHNPLVEDACKRYNINMHVVPFRHKYFWDAGIHCVTNDLHRDGQCQQFLS